MKNTIVCVTCKIEKPEDLFHISNQSKTGRTSNCKQCAAKYGKEYRANAAINYTKSHRNKIIKYLGGKCIICSYQKYQGALDIHHVFPSIKNRDRLNWVLERDYLELFDCILLCSNCHAEVHAGHHHSSIQPLLTLSKKIQVSNKHLIGKFDAFE